MPPLTLRGSTCRLDFILFKKIDPMPTDKKGNPILRQRYIIHVEDDSIFFLT